jgi:hypothetical protein
MSQVDFRGLDLFAVKSADQRELVGRMRSDLIGEKEAVVTRPRFGRSISGSAAEDSRRFRVEEDEAAIGGSDRDAVAHAAEDRLEDACLFAQFTNLGLRSRIDHGRASRAGGIGFWGRHEIRLHMLTLRFTAGAGAVVKVVRRGPIAGAKKQEMVASTWGRTPSRT